MPSCPPPPPEKKGGNQSGGITPTVLGAQTWGNGYITLASRGTPPPPPKGARKSPRLHNPYLPEGPNVVGLVFHVSLYPCVDTQKENIYLVYLCLFDYHTTRGSRNTQQKVFMSFLFFSPHMKLQPPPSWANGRGALTCRNYPKKRGTGTNRSRERKERHRQCA